MIPKCETCGGELRIVGKEENRIYCICKSCGQDVWLSKDIVEA